MDTLNRVRFTTATTGSGTTAIADGAALQGGFTNLTNAANPAPVDGKSYYYVIETGTDAEIQFQPYSASAKTLARGTPEWSTNAGSRITIPAGGATVGIIESAAAFAQFATIADTRTWSTTASLFVGNGMTLSGTNGTQLTIQATGITSAAKAQLGAGYFTLGTTSADPLVFVTNNTEVGRFNSYGGLTVGGDIIATAGLRTNNGTLTMAAATPQSIQFVSGAAADQKYSRIYSGASYTILDFANDAFSNSNIAMQINRSGYQPTSINFGTGLYPLVDNSYPLGNSSVRWSSIYLANNPIVGSDARTKGVPRNFDDKFLDAWGRVRWCMFQYLDAIAKKGEEWARWNLGAIAQEVRDDLLAGGVDGRRYGLLCYDEWDAIEHIEQPFVPAVLATPAFEGIARTIDDEGNVTDWLSPPREAKPEVPAVPAAVLQQGREAGDLWSLRPTQMLVAEAAWSRREHAQAASTVAELIDRVTKLEQRAA